MANFKSGKIQFSRLTTVTSGGTLTLIASAKQIQIFTGTQAHTMKLPDATTTSNGSGISISVINKSTGAITVQDNGSNVIATVAAGSSLDLLLTDHSTANGVWRLGSFSSTGGGGAGAVAPSNLNPGTRGIVTGGRDGGSVAQTLIQYTAIATQGNTIGFGNLIAAKRSHGACASTTRGLAGADTTNSATIEYFTLQTLGNSLSFGNLTTGRGTVGCLSNATRGLWAGGNLPANPSTLMDYVTIATLANALNFGALTVGRDNLQGCASPTRGVWMGGTNGAGSPVNVTDYVTIASTGAATSFGNLTVSRGLSACQASSVRGLMLGGFNGSTFTTTIDYITIASAGNAIAFGSLAVGKYDSASFGSNLRACITGGDSGGNSSTIEYVEIATLSNGASFGTALYSSKSAAGCSNCHGGVQ